MKTHSSYLLIALASVAFAGCADDEPPAPEDITGVSLQRAQSCEDLEARLKRDALVKMNRAIDVQIDMIREYGSPWGPYPYGEGDAVAATGNAASSSAATSGAGGGGGNTPPPAPDHSNTNTQVEGVDEADIVKTDGNFLYVLHGRDLAILSAWPASDLAVASMTRIEGDAYEMFLAGDQLVVYSSIYGDAVYNQAGIAGRDDGYGYYYYPSLTKVTILSLNGSQTQTLSEVYFEGNYLSSRRIGSRVRTVLSGGYYSPIYQTWPTTTTYDSYPQDPDGWIDLFETLRWKNVGLINAAALSDLIPRRFVKVGGELTQLPPSCESYYVPPPGSTSDGLTQIQSFDLDALQNGIAETQIVGLASTVYSNADAMYLAGESWRDPYYDRRDWEVPISTSRTLLHKFDIASDPAAPTYVASGSVPGWLNNQFSMDEKDGVLRLATTDTIVSIDTSEQVNNLFTMQEREGTLGILGSIQGLAKGESIQSVRFVEDTGYVVTFRQVDPLFVIDVADPSAPKVMAALKIPGFSEYMHPLGDGYLLTIGRDATIQGQQLDTALQIFDVRDPTSPKLVDKQVLQSGYSEAESNHKAFTFYNGMLAIPMLGYDANYGLGKTTLELFKVDVASGIVPQGSIDHTAFYQTYDPNYCYYYGWGVRRGVFVEDYVYAISEGGVTVHQLGNLSTPVASATMPFIDYQDCYY